MIHKVCFYGTYRFGEYGHRRLKMKHGQNAVLYRETVTINGFVIYLSRKGNSAVCCRGNMSDRLVVDLCDLDGDEVYNSVLLDVAASIVQEELVAINDWFYSILVYTFRPIDGVLIESGDWSKLPKIIENVENY